MGQRMMRPSIAAPSVAATISTGKGNKPLPHPKTS